MKKHIPNFLTCLNLFCGCIATVCIFRNHLDWAAYLVFIAAFFDLLDGMAARILKVNSPIGKDLDSLADVVSFGFVPGAVLFRLLQMSNLSSVSSDENIIRAVEFLPFIVTIFSALRLAKFNNDARQSESFIGLPTPAATLLIVSLPLILQDDMLNLRSIILNPYFILLLTAIMSFLLVCELPLFSLKFKKKGWAENKFQYILLIIAPVLLFILHFTAVPLIIFFYILLSIIKSGVRSLE